MSKEDYEKAYRLGKREYQARMVRGQLPTLEVLDDILPPRGSYSEVNLGLVQIPAEQLVGTKTGARSSAFAANFMPILRDRTEFAEKWAILSTSHEEEGIREPIKAYEYMNKFYVEEGNKRVSVMKYFGAVSIPGMVTRIIPKRTEEKENKLYYEFLDFYDLTQINYIWFTRLGSFEKLQEAVGKKPGQVWNEEERKTFSSVYSRFLGEYERLGGKKLEITPGDAFLSFISLYGYRAVMEETISDLKMLLDKSWEEFRLLEKEDEIDLKMDPQREKKPLLNRLLPLSSPRLKIAFIYEKTPESSAWTYAHELGRLHLEQAFPEEVSTLCYTEASEDNLRRYLDQAIHEEKCDIVFTTTPSMVQESVKAAIANPSVRILNCSLNTSHRYIRTYYGRMYEAKFLMGAIAGALAEHDRLAYVADYPIYGAIANINAFALGARMVNPRVKVDLEWSTLKEGDVEEGLKAWKPDCISGKDMLVPEEGGRFFGLFRMKGEFPVNLAMPLWHWGKFYERLIRTIMDGNWKYDELSAENRAINYWWGMSAEVIDVICSKSLPTGTKRLVDFLKNSISKGKFSPFYGILYSQKGIVQSDPERQLTPDEIMDMDWLAENIEGRIPRMEELREQAVPVTRQQGVVRKKGLQRV